MDSLETRILEVLTDDARTPVSEIAVMLGRAEEEIAAAISDMEQKRIILKYPALINWDKVESGEVEALIEVRVTPQRDHGFDAIAEQIYRFEEVRNVYLMSGGYDLLVMLKAPSLKNWRCLWPKNFPPLRACFPRLRISCSSATKTRALSPMKNAKTGGSRLRRELRKGSLPPRGRGAAVGHSQIF